MYHHLFPYYRSHLVARLFYKEHANEGILGTSLVLFIHSFQFSPTNIPSCYVPRYYILVVLFGSQNFHPAENVGISKFVLIPIWDKKLKYPHFSWHGNILKNCIHNILFLHFLSKSNVWPSGIQIFQFGLLN